MSAQHFKELLETVCMTTGATKKAIGDAIGIHPSRMCHWQNHGVPAAIKPYVMSVIRGILIGSIAA